MKLNPFPHLLRKISKIQQELITLWNAKILDHVSHQRALKHPVEAFNLWSNLSQNIDERLSRCRLCPELQALLSVVQRLRATEQRKLPSDESQKFKTISFMNTPVCNLISDHALNSVVSSKTLLQQMKKSSSSHALFFTHQHHWMLQPDSFSHLSPILVMNQRHPWAKSLQPIAEAAKFLGTCAPVFPLWSRSGRDPFRIHTTLSWWTILASSTSSKFS